MKLFVLAAAVLVTAALSSCAVDYQTPAGNKIGFRLTPSSQDWKEIRGLRIR